MKPSTTESAESYAAEVAGLLWPAPWGTPYVTRTMRRAAPSVRDAYIFPSTGNPRLLVPADLPSAAAMLKRLGDDKSRLVPPMRRILQTSVRSSAFGLARWPRLRVTDGGLGADSIERHLGGVLGQDVRVGVVLGPRRVNQKPVLQIFGLDGAVLGYAKIGHNALTTDLVQCEAESLRAIGRLRPQTFRTPRLLHHGSWSGLEVLVMSALSPEPGVPVSPARRIEAMQELARLGGVRSVNLADSSYWARVRDRAESLAAAEQGTSLPFAAERIEAADGAAEVSLGGWHGDWHPWNMGMADGVLQLWDWERFDAQVPVGFDALHFEAQSVRPGHPDEHAQEHRFLASASATLTTFGVDPDQHHLVLRLYLLEMAVRYVDALTHGTTEEFVRRTSWVISLLDRLLDRPFPTSSKGAS